ncbi:hypothetical protein ACXIUT_27100 [Achromobacter denitrificans]
MSASHNTETTRIFRMANGSIGAGHSAGCRRRSHPPTYPLFRRIKLNNKNPLETKNPAFTLGSMGILNLDELA